jgi:cell division protein FtsW
VFFSVAGVILMLAVSLLDPIAVRRLAVLMLGISFAGLVAVYFLGEEINGARRWLSIEGHSIQPSEFAKPAFVVVTGWLMAESRRRPDMPALFFAVLLFAAVALLLVVQPDVGQTMLVTLVWTVMLFVSGVAVLGTLFVAVAGAVGLYAAYLYFPHVAARFDRFLNPSAIGDYSQGERAIRSFVEGGFVGRGPGEGTIKTSLPDAHTDYIFAVVAEEYGAFACLALLALFAFVVLRALRHAESEPDASVRLGIVGLALIFGFQALINMGVNVGLLPAKGMTLPFLSAGGSSMLAISLTLGFLLALTRRRPDVDRLKKPPLMPSLPSLKQASLKPTTEPKPSESKT